MSVTDEFNLAELEAVKKWKYAKRWVNSTNGKFSAVDFGRECGYIDIAERNAVISDLIEEGNIKPFGIFTADTLSVTVKLNLWTGRIQVSNPIKFGCPTG